MEEATAVQKNPLLLVWGLQKCTWMFHSATGKIFYGQVKLQLSCWCAVPSKHQNLIPTVKYGEGNIMVWIWFAASGPGQLAVIDGKINSQVYQDIFQENVRLPVRQLKLNRSWVMQQDNDPKHRSRSTTEWLQQMKICLLEWPSQSPDLNLI